MLCCMMYIFVRWFVGEGGSAGKLGYLGGKGREGNHFQVRVAQRVMLVCSACNLCVCS